MTELVLFLKQAIYSRNIALYRLAISALSQAGHLARTVHLIYRLCNPSTSRNFVSMQAVCSTSAVGVKGLTVSRSTGVSRALFIHRNSVAHLALHGFRHQSVLGETQHNSCAVRRQKQPSERTRSAAGTDVEDVACLLSVLPRSPGFGLLTGRLLLQLV